MKYPESTRLKLIPLSKDELEMYLLNDFSFETHFGLEHHPREVSPALRISIEERTIPNLLRLPEHQLFYTHWNVIDTTINTMVAGIILKGPPKENGEVEIGYGTLPAFTGRGYMKETVKIFCEWTFSQDNVKTIVALTDEENVASQRILAWNKFIVVGKKEKELRWELKGNKQ